MSAAPLLVSPVEVRVPGFEADDSILVAPAVAAAVPTPPLAPPAPDCTPLPSSPFPLDRLPSPVESVSIQDRSGLALTRFYQALSASAAGKGMARIMYFGDSHVASDVMTGRVRRNLQARFGDGGAGFFMPIKPARWYAHAGVDFERDAGWAVVSVRKSGRIGRYAGPSGFALQSDGVASALFYVRPGSFEPLPDASVLPAGSLASAAQPTAAATVGTDAAPPRVVPAAVASTSTVRAVAAAPLAAAAPAPEAPLAAPARLGLYYLRQPNGGQVMVTFDRQSATVISTEGSLSAGYSELPIENVPRQVEVDTVGDGDVRLFGVSLEQGTHGVVLDVLGIPGARARDHLLWDDVLYREHLIERDPSLVVLAYGTNEGMDSDEPLEVYEHQLRQVVGRIRSARPAASCLLIGPTDHPQRLGKGFRERRRTDQVVRAQRRIATEAGCGFLDLVAVTGGPMSMLRMVEAHLGAKDHTHLTRRGYEAVGDAITTTLLDGYARWQKSACTTRRSQLGRSELDRR